MSKKTKMDARFKLSGVEYRDAWAVERLTEVSSQRDELCSALKDLADNAIGEKEWIDDFPTFPRDYRLYALILETFLSPQSVNAAAKAITQELNERLSNRLKKEFGSSSFAGKEELAKMINIDTSFEYKLVSNTPNACIPWEPPKGGHITETTIWYSQDSVTWDRLSWPIESDEKGVFTYNVDCSITFEVE